MGLLADYGHYGGRGQAEDFIEITVGAGPRGPGDPGFPAGLARSQSSRSYETDLHRAREAQQPGCAWRPRNGSASHGTRRARRSDKRKGFTETDYARFLDAAHQQPGGPVVLVWDNLSRAMRELVLLAGP